MPLAMLWPSGPNALVDAIVNVLMDIGDHWEAAAVQATGSLLTGGTLQQVGLFTPASGRGPFIAFGITHGNTDAEGNGFFSDANAQLTVDAKNVFFSPVTYESIVVKMQDALDPAIPFSWFLPGPNAFTGWPAPLPLARGSTLSLQKNNFSRTDAELAWLSGFYVSDRAYEHFKTLPVLGGFGFEVAMPAPTVGEGVGGFKLTKDLFVRNWGVQARDALPVAADGYDYVELMFNTNTVHRATAIGWRPFPGPTNYLQPLARIDMSVRTGDQFNARGRLRTGATSRRDLWTFLGMQEPENI